MYIYRENEAPLKDGVGLFGYTNSATISELTVKGEIEISGNSARQVTNIGGVVGCADATQLSKAFSYVNIHNTGGETAHVMSGWRRLQWRLHIPMYVFRNCRCGQYV